MKISEIENKSKPDESEYGWSRLEDLKMLAKHHGDRMVENDKYQLFVPRTQSFLHKRSDRIKSLISNQYAWKDETSDELKPHYQDWVNKGSIGESRPILVPGRGTQQPKHGGTKPVSALWTSTAIKTENGYTSSWVEWCKNNQRSWLSDVGYLYKIKPGALILELNHDYDAERLYYAFSDVNRVVSKNDQDSEKMHINFPWPELMKHFDAIHHYGGYSLTNRFVYGWDVESTAWFDTRFLDFVGKVNIDTTGSDDT